PLLHQAGQILRLGGPALPGRVCPLLQRDFHQFHKILGSFLIVLSHLEISVIWGPGLRRWTTAPALLNLPPSGNGETGGQPLTRRLASVWRESLMTGFCSQFHPAAQRPHGTHAAAGTLRTYSLFHHHTRWAGGPLSR